MELQIIQSKIHTLRGQRVMLDFDLAVLYDVETKYLKRAVKRNLVRFPTDFCFELDKGEWENLRFQFGTSSWGGSRYLPFAFTEHGVAMLSSVLNSDRAIITNIAIIRAFISLRHYALSLAELSDKVLAHDKELADINEVLRWLGDENQARYDENQALQSGEITPGEWAERARIGFRKDT
ncbi:MAG: ORF6N domain-containing protein [Saprospiraceae bacterium]|nr:ORF6N domain-containing protein [Saprospiraceae bacterium]